MPEYIERGAAIELLHYNADETCSAVVCDFEAIPAADVATVVHGRWVHAGYGFDGNVAWWHCSRCGGLADDMERNYFAYCPLCGARMDGGAGNAAD